MSANITFPRPTLLSTLFPGGMRRRWWMFRLIDLIVALWPVMGAKRGLVVVRMDGIGDMVMMRRSLDHYPQAFGFDQSEITILGCHSWKSLAEHAFSGWRVETIDEHAFEKKFFYRLKVALWLRRQNFAVAVCDMFMRKVLTADSLMLMSGASQRVCTLPFITDRTRAEYHWYLARMSRVIDTGPYPRHVAIRHAAFLSAVMGRIVAPEAPRLPWREAASPVPPGAPYVVLNFGSNEPGRRWPFDKFLAIAHKLAALGYRPVFVGGKAEMAYLPQLEQGAPGESVNLIGKSSLPQLVDTLRHGAAVLSNDTGPGHLAIGLGTPCVVIAGGGHFGSFVPYDESACPPKAHFVSKPMDCYHCLWRCPLRAGDQNSFPCVGDIDIETVWQSLVRLLPRRGEAANPAPRLAETVEPAPSNGLS